MPYKRHHRKQHRLSSYWLIPTSVQHRLRSEFPSCQQPIRSSADVVSADDVCRAVSNPAYLHKKFREKNTVYRIIIIIIIITMQKFRRDIQVI
jgi:hypothetical protein